VLLNLLLIFGARLDRCSRKVEVAGYGSFHRSRRVEAESAGGRCRCGRRIVKGEAGEAAVARRRRRAEGESAWFRSRRGGCRRCRCGRCRRRVEREAAEACVCRRRCCGFLFFECESEVGGLRGAAARDRWLLRRIDDEGRAEVERGGSRRRG